MTTTTPLLQVSHLSVSFSSYAGTVEAVRDVSFSLEKGHTLAIVGESGCGKSVTAKALMGLVQEPGKIDPRSRIMIAGNNLLTMTSSELRSYQGATAAMVFQEALSSLDPTFRIGSHLVEALRAHQQLSKAQAKARALELLREVGIPEPERRYKQYPHELSGGMRQRVMIAMAFANSPDLLICDEPTTALDVTMQDQILESIRSMQAQHTTAVIMITHDMGVVASIAQDMVVMYAGTIVERGSTQQIFSVPKHPYTQALMASVPRVDMSKAEPLAAIPGAPPRLIHPPQGCPFAARCQHAMPRCFEAAPPVVDFCDGHTVSCWLHKEVD